MAAPVIDFTTRVKANGHAPLHAPRQSRICDWDCGAVVMLSMVDDVCPHPPCTAVARWRIDIDEVRQRFAVTIQREDRTDSLQLRAGWSERETPEQRVRREAQTDLLRQMLAASYGVPG